MGVQCTVHVWQRIHLWEKVWQSLNVIDIQNENSNTQDKTFFLIFKSLTLFHKFILIYFKNDLFECFVVDGKINLHKMWKRTFFTIQTMEKSSFFFCRLEFQLKSSLRYDTSERKCPLNTIYTDKNTNGVSVESE